MNSPPSAVLLSSLISHLVIILFFLFPPSDPLAIVNSFPSSRHGFQDSLFSLLHHFISTTDVAATISFLSFSRKRKRAHFQELDDNDDGEPESRLGRVGSVVSRNPDEFKQFFRMKAASFEWLCGLLEPLLECRDPVDSPLNLPAEIRLGIGLFRLATGADYEEISTRFGVSEEDSRFCVKHLCRVLCTNYRFWVGFPSHAELESVSAQFENLTGLPNCCGVMSCTRFTMGPQESVAAQIVVDSSSRILSIIAGFHGHKGDLNILKCSTLFKDIEKGAILNSRAVVDVNDVSVPQYLVGCGEYTLFPWLLVPFRNPEPGSVEENFNNVHRLMCVSSSKAAASLRNWGVLNRLIETEYKAMVACIGACSILHNMLIMREDYSAFCDELNDEAVFDQSISSFGGNLNDKKALAIRKALATRASK